MQTTLHFSQTCCTQQIVCFQLFSCDCCLNLFAVSFNFDFYVCLSHFVWIRYGSAGRGEDRGDPSRSNTVPVIFSLSQTFYTPAKFVHAEEPNGPADVLSPAWYTPACSVALICTYAVCVYVSMWIQCEMSDLRSGFRPRFSVKSAEMYHLQRVELAVLPICTIDLHCRDEENVFHHSIGEGNPVFKIFQRALGFGSFLSHREFLVCG